MPGFQSQPTETPPDVRAFMDAVRRGDRDQVRKLLARNAALVASHDYRCFGATPLIQAANRRDRELVDLLLASGADIRGRSDWWAGSYGVLPHDDAEMARFLIERGAPIDAHVAAHMGLLDELRGMLRRDPALAHARGGDGQFPLHYAATPEVAALLIEHGADIDGRCVDHESTPAQYAARPRPEVARFLIANGAATDIFMLVAIGDVDRLRELLQREPPLLHARINDETFPTSANTNAHHIYAYTLDYDATALHIAAKCGRPEIIELLIERGADPNIAGAYDDCTPLHLAAWESQVASAAALLRLGADINRRSGKTHHNEPLGWACVAGEVDAVRFLLERGARVQSHHLENVRATLGGGANYKNHPRAAFEEIERLLVAVG